MHTLACFNDYTTTINIFLYLPFSHFCSK